MSDTALENAITRREHLLSEISSLEGSLKEKKAEIERVNRFIQAWHEFAEPVSSKPIADVPDTISAESSRNPKKEEVAELAIKTIRHYRRPLPRSTLYSLMRADGFELKGKEPEMVLSTMLWRMRNVVVRLPKHGYWPASDPYPSAGYDPAKPSEPEAGLAGILLP